MIRRVLHWFSDEARTERLNRRTVALLRRAASKR